MKTCKNCYHWKADTWGLCSLVNVGVGQLWRCDKWEPKAALPSNKDTHMNTNYSSMPKK
jgi:hypothetical protein